MFKLNFNSAYFLDQHETTFTSKNPHENSLNIIFLTQSSVSSSVAH